MNSEPRARAETEKKTAKAKKWNLGESNPILLLNFLNYKTFGAAMQVPFPQQITSSIRTLLQQ
jgi:hypothetical protein